MLGTERNSAVRYCAFRGIVRYIAPPITTLLEKTKALLRDMDEPYTTAAPRWGVSKRWIMSVLSGEIEDPGVCKIERIYNDLTGRAEARDKREMRREARRA